MSEAKEGSRHVGSVVPRDYCSTVPSALWQIYPVPVCYISYLDILGSLESTLFCVCDHHNMTVARHLRSREPKLAAGDLDTTRV